MKLTTAALLVFACASALANSVPYEDTAVYARDLYERSNDEALESFEKRTRSKPSLSKSVAGAAGNFGGVVAGHAVLYALEQKMTPPTPPQQQRRSLSVMRRRRVPNGGPFAASLAPMRRKGKGVATSFFNGFAQGVSGLDTRGLEEGVLDELE